MTDDIKKDGGDFVDAEKSPIETFRNAHPPMDPERRKIVEKSMKRKLDARCSLFVLIYIMNYLDRNNMAAARLRGLQEDLKLSDTQYATCLSILYVGYILMQVSRFEDTEIVRSMLIRTSPGPLEHHYQPYLQAIMVYRTCHASMGYGLNPLWSRQRFRRHGRHPFLPWFRRSRFPPRRPAHPVEMVHPPRIDHQKRNLVLR